MSPMSCWGAVSPVLVFLFGLILVALIGLADYWIGTEAALTLFYLIPIMGVTWYGNKRLGLATAFLSVITWIAAERVAGVVYTQQWTFYWNHSTRLIVYLILLFLLAEFKAKLRLTETLATTDALTGAVNRRGFNLLAGLEIAKAHRAKTPLTTAYIDLDNFKLVNDEYGHDEGDKALQLIVTVMRDNLRQSDTLARLGGDEFAVLLPDTESNTAQTVMNRLHQALLKAMEERDYPVTFSIGVVTFTRPPLSVNTLISTADQVMYLVKRSGKDRIMYAEVDGQRPEPPTTIEDTE